MIIVEFLAGYTHRLDPRGDVTRSFPQHWRGEVELDIAAAAIVAGAARATAAHSPELEAAIAAHSAPKPSGPSPDQSAFVASLRAEAAAIVTASDTEILAAYQPPAASTPAVAAAPKPAAPRAPRVPRKGRT
jgi:hypothetical protein